MGASIREDKVKPSEINAAGLALGFEALLRFMELELIREKDIDYGTVSYRVQTEGIFDKSLEEEDDPRSLDEILEDAKKSSLSDFAFPQGKC